MPKVFISYSHDSDEHRQAILDLSDRLREDRIDCFIDQYLNGAPAEGWQRWMEKQIEDAAYVLLVCTPTYLKRFKGEDLEGGRGVNFEGVIVSQILYDEFHRSTKFIPVIPDDGSFENVPLMLKKGSTYRFGTEYENLYRVLTDQPSATAKPLGKLKQYPPVNAGSSSPENKSIHIDRLPTVAGEFFGREEELQLLDEALAGDDIRIIQFIAAGGTGKTKLLRHWLNQHEADIPNYLVWSFYSQGTAEDKQVSASPLFTEAFKAFGIDPTVFKTEEEKANALAERLIEHRCLLVLDGLEPLQHGGRGMDGRLKDRAVSHLLKRLAREHSGRCIISTRIEVHDLCDRAHVLSHPLDNLTTADGVRLLESFGVQGPAAEMKAAVVEVEGHALTLHLLGNAVSTYLDGDIRRRDTLEALIDDFDEQGRHAFKVMQAYQGWLRDEDGKPLAELQLLYLLGLFDHPIETGVLEVLWQEQISGLTQDIPNRAWKIAIRDLHDKHHLLSRHEGRPDLLDCHPLIREWFGRQLQNNQPEAWRQAHERLYEYYRALPDKEQPDTLEEMQPLFSAVAHGCAAGLHQRASEEVYYPRIQRSGENYACAKLGAFSDDLAAVAHFFTTPWHTPAAGLGQFLQAAVLNWAGFRLRAPGRLREALEPTQVSTDMAAVQEKWLNAAKGASNLSELQLTLGDVAQAVQSGQRSVEYADRSGDSFQRMSKRTTHADALHQAGEVEAALVLFREAERLQQEYQPAYPRLYSLPGFRYCDLLLAQGGTVEVLERAEYALALSKKFLGKGLGLLDIGLDQLTLGRAHLQQAISSSTELGEEGRNALAQAARWLDQAVAGLREAGQQIMLPCGLLTRADLCRHSGDFPHAHRDLQEVYDIAESSEMRLHLTDYHLELARLLLAENDPEAARQHADTAGQLIEATGYHRRDAELAELERSLSA